MRAKLKDEYGRPPIGARVYIKEQHALATVVGLDFHEKKHFHISFDTGQNGTTHLADTTVSAEDVTVIGPPELVGACAIDTCPICDEDIRIRKGEE